jgi:hypothetical protein
MVKKPQEELSLETLNEKMIRLDRQMREEVLKVDERSSLDIRKLGVAYESMDTKFRLLMEGFGALHRRIDELEQRMDEKFAEIDYKFEFVFRRLDDIDVALAKKLDRDEFLAFQARFPSI